MSGILAAIENSRASRAVLDMGSALGGVLRTRVEAVYARQNDASAAVAVAEAAGVRLRILIGDPGPAILRALDDDDVILGVMGTGRFRTERHPLGRVTREVMTRSPRPIVVVPPEPVVSVRATTVVVPVAGVGPPGSTMRRVLGRLAGGGADLLGLHLVEPSSAPRYWDHYYYDYPAWWTDLRGRCFPFPAARLEVTGGPEVQATLRVAARTAATMIALPWSGDLSGGRGAVVTELIRTTRVPILLVPEPVGSVRPGNRSLTSVA